ncbi:MAG: nuclear transport factor 2 family protein [Bacteroidales bacterium]|nr:nuclear transport factor 2 family protein [Bacteroidales bacterium]
MKKILFAVAIVFLLLNIVGCQQPKTIETPIADGVELVIGLWSDFKSGNQEVFENLIAEGFQSIHQDGARDKDQEITLLMGLHLGEHNLDNFKVTQNDNVVIVTYTVSAYETIEGNVLPTAPAARLSAFQYDGKDWKWIVHANLNPMNK